ncbi:hypothetical protein GCM10022243_64070 [Saccharothrix violaceirubra]|uniref:Uncharacterized protein n=1 Tax=Saccharothrix violaceirubra TaxID=413306 RepID=A0A7W7WZR4_9PSEU|nr:hypothetical protein [Saccharothrix violaceirubra]MBB4969108.1 hypothetical protein [Saccharothrix violaceirubra]
MTTAIVPPGRVLVCCGDHLPTGCCDAEDCAPCCPECPTCVVVQARTPEQRARDAAAHRDLLLALAAWAEDIEKGAPPWPTSSP